MTTNNRSSIPRHFRCTISFGILWSTSAVDCKAPHGAKRNFRFDSRKQTLGWESQSSFCSIFLYSLGGERICVCFAVFLGCFCIRTLSLSRTHVTEKWKKFINLCRWTEANKSELNEAKMLKTEDFCVSNERKVSDEASTDTTFYCSDAARFMMHDEQRIIFVNKQMRILQRFANTFRLKIGKFQGK